MYKSDLFMKLIEEVQKYELLYNVVHPDRRKRTKTQQIWTVIASDVGDTVQKCKTRWKSLRDRYSREYARMKSDSTAAAYKCDWKYMDAMAFMEGYMNQQNNFLESLSKMTKRDIFCRACLRPVVNSPEEFYDIFVTENFVEKFVQCTNLKSVPWDEYPHLVCEKCYEKVLDFHKFQVMCQDSLQKFNVMLQNQTDVKCDIDEEVEVSESILSQMPENPTASFGDIKHANEKHESRKENDIEEALDVDPLADGTHTTDSVLEESYEVEHILEDCELNEETTQIYKKLLRQAANEETNEKDRKPENNQLEETFINTNNEHVRSEKKYKIEITKYTKVLEEAEEADKMEELESAEVMNVNETDNDYEEYLEALSDQSASDDNETPDLNEKTRKVPLKCDICPQVFHLPHRLEAHQRRHQGLAGYPCTFDNCPRAYNRLRDLRDHLNNHNGIPNIYKCDIDDCNMVYTCFSGLNKHKRNYHKCGKELKTYPCETCGKVLTSPRSLTGHRFIHLDKTEWPYACDEKGCTVKFRFLNQKKIHLKRHAGIKDYVCPHCGMRKTTSTELKIHINFHTFERKYPCHICSKVFKSVGTVSTHIHQVHEGKRRNADGTIFQCSFCDHKSNHAQRMKLHELTHTGERPYACRECGKTFASPAGRHYHMQIHSKGEKPHACEECGKRFKWLSSLISHKKLHVEGAVPYTCAECGQGFKWPGSYYTHKKKHAKEKVHDAQGEEGATEENIEP